jgi:hypothetical protein
LPEVLLEEIISSTGSCSAVKGLLFPNSPRPPFDTLFLAFVLIERCPASGSAHRLDLPGSGRYRDGCPLANLYVIGF